MIRRAYVLLLLFALPVGFAAVDTAYAIPALSRYVFSVNTGAISNNTNVYVTVYTDEQTILSLLQWADDHNICSLAYNNDWLLPVVMYSSDANVSQRPKQYIIIESGTYTFSNCYVPGTTLPATITYPKSLLVNVGILDTFNSEYNTFSHYVYVYQPYPIYDDFIGSQSAWSDGCRDINIPRDAIDDIVPIGTNIIKDGTVYLSEVVINYSGSQLSTTFPPLSRLSDIVPIITGRLGIGWFSISRIDRFCYSGVPGDIYLILMPRW